MPSLFEESTLKNLTLKNRFVRAATWEGLATPEGAVTPALIDMMAALAQGGVGLIISSHAYVSAEGQGTPWQLGVHRDDLVDGLRQMAAAVHANGGRIVLQLAHAGQYAGAALTGAAPLVVSDAGQASDKGARVVTEEDIQRIVASYAQAAGRALAAGFDGIEIHAAHGYFLSQFLSPATNFRRDGYGGSVANRARIHLEIYRAVRAAVGEDVPILIKMNGGDFSENGLTLDESLQAATHFAAAGFDAIEVSGGIITGGKLSPSRPGIASEDKEAYFRDCARRYKEAISIPLVLVGGIRSFEVADRMVREGVADYIAMSRPLIREPGLIARWAGGDRRKAACRSDNLCFKPGFEGGGIRCVTREMEEQSHAGQARTRVD